MYFSAAHWLLDFEGEAATAGGGDCQNADLDAVFSLQCSMDGNNPSRISSKISSFHWQILKVFIFFSDDIVFHVGVKLYLWVTHLKKKTCHP